MDSEQTKTIEQLIKTLPTSMEVLTEEMFFVIRIEQDGKIHESRMTPYLADAVLSGKIRDLVLGDGKNKHHLLFIYYTEQEMRGLERLQQLTQMFPDQKIEDCLWVSLKEKEWISARESAELGFFHKHEFDDSIELIDDLFLETNRSGFVIIRTRENGDEEEISWDEPGRGVTMDEQKLADELAERLEAEDQRERDQQALDFLEKVSDLNDKHEHEEADRLMYTYCGVYLTYSMKALAFSMQQMGEVSNQSAAYWWLAVAINGNQKYAAPVYSVASSGWAKNGDALVTTMCAQRGLNEEQLAELFVEFA